MGEIAHIAYLSLLAACSSSVVLKYVWRASEYLDGFGGGRKTDYGRFYGGRSVAAR